MNEDKVIETIVNLQSDVSDIKEKIKKLDILDSIFQGQDQMMQILLRVDQERVFTNEKIKYLEQEVNKIKLHLHIH